VLCFLVGLVPKISHGHLLDEFLGHEIERTVRIMTKIASEVKGNWTSTFQLELVVIFKGSDDVLGVLTDNGKVVDIDSYILVVVTNTAHPDVRFCLAREESHLT